MSEDSKQQVQWTLIYHGGGVWFKGRGEFLRLMFEDSKTEYVYSGDNIKSATTMMDCFRESAEAVLKEDDLNLPNPIFFPPAVWHRPPGGDGVLINQVAACMMYMGDVLGYSPKTAGGRALATSILLNTMDYISRGRSSFHPVKDNMSYSLQKEEGDKSSLEWTKTNMPIWLAHFEKVVKKHGPNAPVAGGDTVSFADFALFQCLDATIAQFNNEKYEMAWDKQSVPVLKEYHLWMRNRPNLKAYFESDRCAPWAGDSMM